MLKVTSLLLLMILVASFPFISDWIAKNKNNVIYDDYYINGIISNYIEGNPDQILSSLRKHTLNKEEEARESFVKNAIQEHSDRIYNLDYPTAGEGEVKVVEFFDYACSYCKRIGGDIEKLIKSENVTYIFREVPIFGNDLAVRAGLAVNLIDNSKYFDFHKKLLARSGAYTEDVIKKLVQQEGIDLDGFEEAWNSEKVTEMMKDSLDLFHKLGMGGTPSFIVCDKAVIGASIDSLRKEIAECDSSQK